MTGGSRYIPASSVSCYPDGMAEEPTQEEIDARAREIARRVMSKPYERQDWPKAPQGEQAERREGEAKPSKSERP